MSVETMDPKAMVVLGGPENEPMEAHLWVCSGENIGRRFALDKPENVIGRTPNIDISILDERVSQRHAKVVLQEGRHYVEDLGSTNGTFVNNHPLTGPRRLQDGDLIQVGETVFEYISYEKRNTNSTLRGTNRDTDAVPANLRAGAQEALNRARATGHTPPGVPVSGPGFSRTTADVAAQPYPHHPMANVPHQNPYLGMYEERRGMFVDQQQDDEEGGMDIQEIIRKVKMVILFFLPYWQLVLTLGIVLGLVGALTIKLTPPRRTAVFQVSLVPNISRNPIGEYSGNVAFFKSAQQNFKASQQVARTLAELGLPDINPGLVAAVQADLIFQSVGPPQPNTYRGSFTSSEGDFAVKFLKTHVKLFLDTEIEKTLRVMKGEAEFLAEQLAETEAELRRTEEELKTFKKENIEGMPEQAQANYSLLFNLKQEKNRVEIALARAQAQQRLTQNQLETESPLAPKEVTRSDPYREVIASKSARLAEARANGKGPNHPDVVRLTKEIEELKKLSKQAQEVAAKTVTTQNPTYIAIMNQYRQQQLTEAMARKELGKINKRIAEIEKVVKRLPDLEAQHAELTRSYGAAREKFTRIYEKLSATKIQLELERASAAARYDIISPPSLEFVNTKKQMLVRGFLGLAGGVFLGLLIAAIVQLRNHPVVTTALTLRDPDEPPAVR